MNFKREAVDINERYDKLTYTENEKEVPCISGELELKDEEGGLIDSYFIIIKPTSYYPFRFPHVFEVKGRIPINIDWHVFPYDGHCCIKAIPEEIFICKKGITLDQFIKHQVIPYFFNQKYRELYGFFLNERSHGVKGNAEFFKDVFNTHDLTIIRKAIDLCLEKKEPSKVAKCFCGSRRKYRKCHRRSFRLLSAFSESELKNFLTYFN